MFSFDRRGFALLMANNLTGVHMDSATFPDPQRATDDLQTFAKMNEKRLYKLLKTAMDPQTDLKTLVKTTVGVLPFASPPSFVRIIDVS